MTSWIKNALLDTLDTIGFVPDSGEPSRTTHGKRKATEDSRGRTKLQRYRCSDEANRNVSIKAQGTVDFVRAKTQIAALSKERQLLNKPKSINAAGPSLPRAPIAWSSSASRERVDSMLLPPAVRLFSSGDILQPPQTSRANANLLKKQLLGPAEMDSTSTNTNSNVAMNVGKSWKQGMSVDEKWATQPNKRAHEVAMGTLDARTAILCQPKEPEYALRDVEVRDALWHVMDLMERFSKKFFGFEIDKHNGHLLRSFFEQFNPETAKIIGCVASGGPGGVQGWHDLFLDRQKRRALVMAIIGNVLVEQVFQHIFFGGILKHVKRLNKVQEEYKDDDGFDRNRQYATYLRSILDTEGIESFLLPANFANHVNYIVGVIYTHIKPILSLHPADDSPIPDLHMLVVHAGILSLCMRMDLHTVYHFEPVFKEDTFTSKRMDCFNREEMEQTNPRTPDTEPLLSKQEKARRARISADEKKRAKHDDALTQITILDGVTAYRLGGWETATSTILEPEFEKSEYEDKGVRVRVITHGWVYCRWGRARRFKDGKSADVPAAHGAAWKDGGFKEFSDVKGVVDWTQMARDAGGPANQALAKGKGRAVDVGASVSKGRSVGPMAGTSKRVDKLQEMDLQAQLNEECSE